MPPAADLHVPAAPASESPSGPAPLLVRRQGRAMASPLRLCVAAGGDARRIDPRVDAAWADVRAAFERAEAAMSRFRDDSELTRLNRRAPVRAPVSRDLGRALAAADRARRVTGGRFDPRIIEALERIGYAGVWQSATDRPAAPATGRVVGLDCGARSVVLEVPVDLGGIGKGLALRWAADDLERRLNGDRGGATGFLLDAGGDVVASGSLGGGEAWQVGIEDPEGGPEPLAVVAIRGRGAIATSSISAAPMGSPGPGRPPPHRPADRRARRRGPAGRHGRGPGSSLGRGLVEGPFPRGLERDREPCPDPGARGVVGDERRPARDDAGRPPARDLGGVRGLNPAGGSSGAGSR